MCESVSIQNPFDKWNHIKAEQGFIGKAWNGVKEFANIGKSESDCESALLKYQNGEMTLDEAMDYIEDFEKKQNDMTNLIANIATGGASIALATVAAGCGRIDWGLATMKGAPLGALVKSSIKTLDRATNGIEGDELDGKELLKDAVSGAVTGTTSAVSSKVYTGVENAKLSTSLLNGTICGLECGALSGASNYLTDTALEKDNKFDFGELTRNTVKSAFISGTVGGVVGGGIYGVENLAGHIGKEVSLSTAGTIARDTATSSSRKILGNCERKLIDA